MLNDPRRRERGRRSVARLVTRRGALGLVLVCACLAVPSLARAGGDFVDLAVAGSRVWFVGEPGVRELDATTGRVVASTQLVGAPYPLSVALDGGAAWVASVENGYVWGTLTRIDNRTGRTRVLWRKPDSSVQYVAAGAGGVWALIGSAGTTRIALFTLTGRLARTWSIPDAGRMAADAGGCWISTTHWLLHIDPAGRIHRVLRAQLGDVSTGAGAVWLPQAASVIRLDERTGQIRTLHTGRLQLGGFQHGLAVGDGALWAIDHGTRSHTRLERFNMRTGRKSGGLDLPGIADALIVKPKAIWIATVIAPPNKPASGYDIVRIDPHTLHRDLTVHLT
jgi:hypothetical protein